MPHHSNPWCWHRNHSPLFGITARQVVNIFLTYKVAHQLGKLSQQYRHPLHLVMKYHGAPRINKVNKVEDKKID
jgi:hypothetical protein